jgi:hypothetical protein
MRLLIIFFLFLLSCSQNPNSETEIEDKEQESDAKDLSFKSLEERFKYEVSKKLSISKDEKFTIDVKYEFLNSDDKKDAVITVNRLQKAIDEASKSNNPAKRAELGYLGSYNFFFFYDGAKDAVSVPIMLGSSAKAPLKISFENIQSEFYKDIIVDYKIRNAAFRNYYLIQDQTLQLAFSWKIYDKIGEKEYEANFFEYNEGTFSLAKDISIYSGKITDYTEKINDIYTFEPYITKQKDLQYRFFFDPKKLKYVTNAKPKDET